MNIVQTRRLIGRLFCCFISVLSAATVARGAQPTTTTIADVVYRADGTPAQGTLLISWPAFVTLDKNAVAAGSMSVKLGAGGRLNLGLVPNHGALPQGTYYKVMLKLDDGTTNTEYWSVPTTSPTTISAVRTTISPQASPSGGGSGANWATTAYVDAQDSTRQPVSGRDVNGGYVGRDAQGNASVPGALTAGDLVVQGPWRDVRTFGALCDGVHDDTAALQAALNYFGHGPGQGGHDGQLLIPPGQCRISNTLTYLGSVGGGFKMGGTVGYDRGPSMSTIGWHGPKCGTMLQLLGANSTYVENVNFQADAGGAATAACNTIWHDASNTVTEATWTIAGATRAAGGLTTFTTSAAHTLVSGNVVSIAGAADASFNGTWRVQSAGPGAAFTVVQGGSAGTTTGGSATLYRSAPASGNYIDRVSAIGFQSPTTTVTAISGAGPTTVTTASPHYATAGDTVLYYGGSDASYAMPYVVTAVASPTSLTLTPLIVQSLHAPSGAPATGGTLVAGSSGIRFGNRPNAPQEDTVRVASVLIQGSNNGTSMSCFKWDAGGNTKGFDFDHVGCNGTVFGVDGFASGQLRVGYYQAGLAPNANVPSGGAHFLNVNGQIQIDSAEVEDASGTRFLSTGGAGTTVTLRNVSYQSQAPADDVVINSGASLMVLSSYFRNGRIDGTTIPKITMSCAGSWDSAANPINRCGFWSTGTRYYGVTTGFVPLYDGNGNLIWGAGDDNPDAFNATSNADQGCATSSCQLKSFTVLSRLGIGDADPTYTTYKLLASQGDLRLTKRFTAYFRNNAHSGNVHAWSLDTNDRVRIGGANGIGLGQSGPTWAYGAGAPSGACAPGALYTPTDGGAGSTLYVCESGGWAAK